MDITAVISLRIRFPDQVFTSTWEERKILY